MSDPNVGNPNVNVNVNVNPANPKGAGALALQYLMKAATATDQDAKETPKAPDRMSTRSRRAQDEALTPAQQAHQQQLANAAQQAQAAVQQLHAAQQQHAQQQAQVQAQQQVQVQIQPQQPPPPQQGQIQVPVQVPVQQQVQQQIQSLPQGLPPGATPVVVAVQPPPTHVIAQPPPSSFGPPVTIMDPSTSTAAADAVAAAVAAANHSQSQSQPQSQPQVITMPMAVPITTTVPPVISVPAAGQGTGSGNLLVTTIETESAAAYVACASGQDVQWKGGVWKLKNGHFSPEETQYILDTVTATRHMCPNLVECLKPIAHHLNRAVRNVRAHYYHQRAPERHMRPKLHVGTRSDLDFYALASEGLRALPNWEGDYLQVAEVIERLHPGELPTVRTLTGYLYVWQKSLGDFMGRHKHFVRTGRKNGGRVIYRFEPGWITNPYTTPQPVHGPDGTTILQPGQTLIYQPGTGMATAPNGMAVHLNPNNVTGPIIGQPSIPHDPNQLVQLYTSPAMQPPVPAVPAPPSSVPTPMPGQILIQPHLIPTSTSTSLPPGTVTAIPITETGIKRKPEDELQDEHNKRQAISTQEAAAHAVAAAMSAAQSASGATTSSSLAVQPTSTIPSATTTVAIPVTTAAAAPVPVPVVVAPSAPETAVSTSVPSG